MKMRMTIALLIVSTMMMTGCGFTSPVIPGYGLVSSFKAPLDIEYDQTDLGTRQGRAEVTSILGIVTTGDCSIEAASKNGGIRTVKHADYEYFNVLGIYSKYTTIVYGD